MSTLDGKVVLLTGAGGGQGAAEAVACAEAGATVIAADITPQNADALPTRVPNLLRRTLDVTDADQWHALVAEVVQRFGRIDGLVNNAGVSVRTRVMDTTPADWERALSVNLTGTLLGIQTVVPHMPAGGSIVNIGSVAALTGFHSAAYAVSKWGVRGLTRVASMELGERGIRVNIIHPGFIETPMTATVSQSFREAVTDATPLGRHGTVGDIAPLVVFLLSDAAGYINGSEISVDGGQTAHGGALPLARAVFGAGPSAE